MFTSNFVAVEKVTMPVFTGVRVMMMPFHTHEVERTLPEYLQQYTNVVEKMSAHSPAGVGYLTVDEAFVRAGEYHRRPGIHVDGVDEFGRAGPWSGGGGGWGATGMTVLSSHVGCQAWRKTVPGWPRPNGDCEHLSEYFYIGQELMPDMIYEFTPMTVHESLRMRFDAHRQFVRVSYPSDAAWYEGYTENPLGIKPTGEIRAGRSGMSYRPSI